jgi:capsular polysaccharide biosynthesis protein
MTGVLLVGLAKIILAIIAGILLTVLPFWVICKRMGFHPALSILSIIPLASIFLRFYLAFTKWPAQQEPNSAGTTSEISDKPKRRLLFIIIGSFLLACAPLVIVTGTAYTFTLPKTYESQALVQTIFSEEAYKNYDKTTLESLTHTYSEKVTGKPILYQTADRLNLVEVWGRNGNPISKEVACKILKSSVTVYRHRNSIDLITISVRRTNPNEAARIANTLAQVYQEAAVRDTTQANPYSIAIVEKAESAMRPVSPNLIMNVLVSLVAAGFFVLVGTPFLIIGLKR